MAATSSFNDLLAAAKDRSLPPVERWNPHRSGAIDIRIAADGDWFHEGALVKRFAIAKLFATILRLDDGDYYLVTPVEKLRIRVDDAPFVAVDMESDGEGSERRLLFRTNVGDVVLADSEHPITVTKSSSGPRPYVEVRRGLRALISRSVYYRLVALADLESDGEVSIWSAGQRFVLGTCAAEDRAD